MIYHQVICKKLSLFYLNLVVTFYIIMSISRVNVIREEKMLCCVWLKILKIWVIFQITVW